MNARILARSRSLHSLLILSMVASFFVLPAVPARAGMLGDFWRSISPLVRVAGQVGGAIVGASMLGAFCPPLGMLAGGVMGWIAGGVITGYATGSLMNLATVAGAAAGMMALGPSVIGLVAGGLLGAFLARTALSLLKKADREVTGGAIFMKGAAQSAAPAGGDVQIPLSAAANPQKPVVQVLPTAPTAPAAGTYDTQLRAAEARYQKAYKAYVDATRGSDASKLAEVAAEYQAAVADYRKLTGRNP